MSGGYRKWSFSLLYKLIEIPAYPALLLLLLTAAAMQPRLLSIPFLLIVLRQAVPLSIAAIGQSLPIIGRSIDLSIGGIIAVANVCLALPVIANGPAWYSIALPLAIGGVIGLTNGILITVVRASAVVVTLGMSVILVGVSYLISGGAPGGQVHALVRFIATDRVATFPVAGLLLIATTASVALIMRRSVFGHALYATGSSFPAAWLGGLAVSKELVVAHIFSGVLAGIAAIVLTGYIGTGTLNLGADLVMASVAAVVLGGTSFGGGLGGVIGVVFGAFALTFLANLLTGMGVEKPFQLVIQGAIIAGAAALARLRER